MRKLHLAIPLLFRDPDTTWAVWAASLALTHSRNQRKELVRLVKAFPALMEHEWFQDIAASVNEFGTSPCTSRPHE